MRFDILTLFPDIFKGFLEESLIKKALERGLLFINVLDIRNETSDRHNTADDSPFGGGPGMVMLAEPVFKSLEKIKTPGSKIVLMSPAGTKLTQDKVKDLSKEEHLIIICGRYEGLDERISASGIEEISIGDYVLSGGELPAAVLIESVSRYIPGVVKEQDSVENDSFSDGLLDFPHYTRPAHSPFGEVPPELLGGNHEEIRKWRRKEQLKRTLFRRPDILTKAKLNEEDKGIIQEIVSDKY
ncbi:MAG: tRNA (guanosine(37)-N1)-methyltransferase TrmD [Candidatus Margulisiibacteriota bacterium]